MLHQRRYPTVTVDALDAALAAAAGSLAKDEQHLAVAVFRLLSAGAPAAITVAAAGITESAAGQALRSWPAVFWDDRDRVTGFCGLPWPGCRQHRVRHAGTDLSAWCAWDPLFLALVIGDLQVAAADPVTRESISCHIGHAGDITSASHPGSVRLKPAWGRRATGVHCRQVNAEGCAAAFQGAEFDDATEAGDDAVDGG